MAYGKITKIEIVHDIKLGNLSGREGSNGSRLGFKGMLSYLVGYEEFDGFQVHTEKNVISVLIANGQNCCEDWGYFETPEDLAYFTGKELKDVTLVDTALNEKRALDEIGALQWQDLKGALYEGGIQFVNFVTDGGVFQLAVYNSQNGYYGHSIIVAINEEIIKDDVI